MRIVLSARKASICVSLLIQYSLILSLPFYRPAPVRAQNKISLPSELSLAAIGPTQDLARPMSTPPIPGIGGGGNGPDGSYGYGRVVRGTVISSPNNPALVGQTNVTITNFAQHPNILVQVTRTIRSTAAGRYQFLNGTWTGLNLPDFGRYNQDVGAVMLLQRTGAITPLLNGNVRQAAANSNGTWASLPNSTLGQPTRTMADFENADTNSLVDCFIRQFRGLP